MAKFSDGDWICRVETNVQRFWSICACRLQETGKARFRSKDNLFQLYSIRFKPTVQKCFYTCFPSFPVPSAWKLNPFLCFHFLFHWRHHGVFPSDLISIATLQIYPLLCLSLPFFLLYSLFLYTFYVFFNSSFNSRLFGTCTYIPAGKEQLSGLPLTCTDDPFWLTIAVIFIVVVFSYFFLARIGSTSKR